MFRTSSSFHIPRVSSRNEWAATGHDMAEVPTVFSGFMVQAAKPSGRKQSGPSKTALVLKRTKEREAANERRKEQAEKLKEEVF